VLTKVAEPVDVAYIFPFSMRNLKAPTSLDPYSIWTVLRLFWSQDRVDAWYKAIFSSGTEVVYNLMCLAPHVHKYHERAYFALEPKEISDDKKRLTVKFFWLPRNQYSPTVDILRTPLIPEDLDGQNHGVGLWNFHTDKRIRSGDEIYLETNDPETLPLPDLRILEMQWILHRVTALSGAAEPRDDFGEDSDDDWNMALRREEDLEAEDEWFAYTPSPEQPLPPTEKSSPRTAITTADESIVSSAGDAIDRKAEIKENTPTDEEKGKRRADIDAVAKFEEREAKKRMVLSSGKY
jgi:hypothetical protein